MLCLMNNNVHLKLLVVVLFLCSFNNCICGGESDLLDNLSSQQIVELETPQETALYLVKAVFENEINIYESQGETRTYMEIHIHDDETGTFLACVGSKQESFFAFMGLDDIVYADLNAQFLAEDGIDLSSYDMLKIKLIKKRGDFCPIASITQWMDMGLPDYVRLDSVSVSYEELVSEEGILFEDYGVFVFSESDDASYTPAEIESVAGGDLVLESLKLVTETFDDNEDDTAELGLMLAEYDTYDVVACTDLDKIEMGGVFYDGLDSSLLTPDLETISTNDLDASTEYWALLVELDEGHCNSGQTDASISPTENDVLATTPAFSLDEMTAGEIEFDDGYGSLWFVLK